MIRAILDGDRFEICPPKSHEPGRRRKSMTRLSACTAQVERLAPYIMDVVSQIPINEEILINMNQFREALAFDHVPLRFFFKRKVKDNS